MRPNIFTTLRLSALNRKYNSYVFHVREWNVDYFKKLASLIKTDANDTPITWLTMEKRTYKALAGVPGRVHFLPDIMKAMLRHDNRHSINEVSKAFVKYMDTVEGTSVERFFAMERAAPRHSASHDFMMAHIDALMKVWPQGALMISLTCDHFVYIISGYIAEYCNGASIFVQPIGAPLAGNLITRTLWQPHVFKELHNSLRTLELYINSLERSSGSTISYMAPQRTFPIWRTAVDSVRRAIAVRLEDNEFAYLDKVAAPVIPSRMRSRFYLRRNSENGLSLPSIQRLAADRTVFFFPLQFEPEISILGGSPWYRDQLEVLRVVSQSLRHGDVLLVKEHPSMVRGRGSAFLSKVNRLPNVMWCSRDIDGRQIIRNSHRVVTITGTAAFEAACLGVNSTIFGYAAFASLLCRPPVCKCAIEDIPKIMYDMLPPEVILNNLREKWPDFARSVFIGDFIPRRSERGNVITDVDVLASRFFTEVIERIQHKS